MYVLILVSQLKIVLQKYIPNETMSIIKMHLNKLTVYSENYKNCKNQTWFYQISTFCWHVGATFASGKSGNNASWNISVPRLPSHWRTTNKESSPLHSSLWPASIWRFDDRNMIDIKSVGKCLNCKEKTYFHIPKNRKNCDTRQRCINFPVYESIIGTTVRQKLLRNKANDPAWSS